MLSGANFVGHSPSRDGDQTYQAANPTTGEILPQAYHEATSDEVERAFTLADECFDDFRSLPASKRANFLDAIANSLLNLGDALLDQCHAETALPMARLQGERARTINQTRMFAAMVREGSWATACIDHDDRTRQPPKPDVRRVMVPLGPVAVFGASNFPLAISIAGSDTVSALGAGCPVIVKVHPSHPGTSEMIANAILTAARATDMPDGVFSMLHGGVDIAREIVQHPLLSAVAFTGSLHAGRAIFDLAAQRQHPIPVFAELGSSNPVFLLNSALKSRAAEIGAGLVQSMNLGVGQFCTQPGIVLGQVSEHWDTFVEAATTALRALTPGTMLSASICDNYRQGVEQLNASGLVQLLAESPASDAPNTGAAALFRCDVRTFLANPQLAEENFGPSTILVECESDADFEAVAARLDGHLTATIHGSSEDIAGHLKLVRLLERRVGRLVFNGFPTGVEVCASMQHGGPYPATTDSRITSIGGGAIMRFVRPLCYQDAPNAVLPAALQRNNPLGVWRLIDGAWSQN
jgi:alpha-ketoglutaric semialdehyde dehydrogenase